jgi:hypothetical protein
MRRRVWKTFFRISVGRERGIVDLSAFKHHWQSMEILKFTPSVEGGCENVNVGILKNSSLL